MRHIVTVAYWVLLYFSTLPHKRHDFRKENVTEHKMCVLIFSTTFVWNISPFKKNWARYDPIFIYRGLHIKYPLLLSDFNETWIFTTGFRKILKHQISLKSSSGSRVVPCGQTWGSKHSLFLILRTRLKIAAGS